MTMAWLVRAHAVILSAGTYDRDFGRNGTFPTEPLAFRDVGYSVAVWYAGGKTVPGSGTISDVP